MFFPRKGTLQRTTPTGHCRSRHRYVVGEIGSTLFAVIFTERCRTHFYYHVTGNRLRWLGQSSQESAKTSHAATSRTKTLVEAPAWGFNRPVRRQRQARFVRHPTRLGDIPAHHCTIIARPGLVDIPFLPPLASLSSIKPHVPSAGIGIYDGQG